MSVDRSFHSIPTGSGRVLLLNAFPTPNEGPLVWVHTPAVSLVKSYEELPCDRSWDGIETHLFDGVELNRELHLQLHHVSASPLVLSYLTA